MYSKRRWKQHGISPSFKIGNTLVPTYTAAGAVNNYFLNITASLNV